MPVFDYDNVQFSDLLSVARPEEASAQSIHAETIDSANLDR